MKTLPLNVKLTLNLVLLMSHHQDMVPLHLLITTMPPQVVLLITIMQLQLKLLYQHMLLKKKQKHQQLVDTEHQKLKHPKINTMPGVKDATSAAISAKDETSVEMLAVTEGDKTTTADVQDAEDVNKDVKADDSVDKCSIELFDNIQQPDKSKFTFSALSRRH